MSLESERQPDDTASQPGASYQRQFTGRFRWRLIPVAALGILGCFLLGAGLLGLTIFSHIALTGEPLYEPGPTEIDLFGALFIFLCVCAGTVLLLSARLWWRSHWLRAILLAGVCITVFGISADMLGKTRFSATSNVAQAPVDIDTSTFVLFDVPETDLTVQLPHEPTSEQITSHTEYGEVEIQLHKAEYTIPKSEAFIFYDVGVNEYSTDFIDSVASTQNNDFLKGLVLGGLRKWPDSKVITRQRITSYGLPGFEERVVIPREGTEEHEPDIEVICCRRLFQEDNRMYLFQISTVESIYETAPDDFDRYVKHFFDSIKSRTQESNP